ncbi:hypothetical protein [Stieleria varia]|uniref:hypothetical protein n=1 Tax=Stieleria varia TaxID=2528005 RepID=UPI0018D2176E|nr:hypothetical protein [Stieleria varia]
MHRYAAISTKDLADALLESRELLLAHPNLTAVATQLVAHVFKLIRRADLALVVIDGQFQTLGQEASDAPAHTLRRRFGLCEDHKVVCIAVAIRSI